MRKIHRTRPDETKHQSDMIILFNEILFFSAWLSNANNETSKSKYV
ncbi:MAG TPA: hypothetical protein VK250_11335 [Nitrososphaeraceae archaeon]|nr:hypothetical protein [Nitrososphaeraceae archaeon]